MKLLSLINLYNNIIYKTKDKVISLRQINCYLMYLVNNRILMNIERGFSESKYHDIKIPPILPIKHTIDTRNK